MSLQHFKHRPLGQKNLQPKKIEPQFYHFCLNKVASSGLEHQVAGKATRISSRSWNLESADVASIFSGFTFKLRRAQRRSGGILMILFHQAATNNTNSRYWQLEVWQLLVLDMIIDIQNQNLKLKPN